MFPTRAKCNESVSVLMNEELRFRDCGGCAPDGGGDDCYIVVSTGSVWQAMKAGHPQPRATQVALNIELNMHFYWSSSAIRRPSFP